MIKFTREQSIALSLDRNMCITANAGSGKTKVLVERFLKILLDDDLDIDPKRVVAITFTKKAASEMLAKIVMNLETAIYNEKDFSKMKKLRKIREKMTYARISTIHSFCGSILRDFPIEADVSPFFYELSNSELLTIRQNSILSAFEGWLQSADDSKKIRAKSLFRELGRTQVYNIVQTLLNKKDILDNLEYLYTKGNDFILRKTYSAIINKITESGRLMFQLSEMVKELEINLSQPQNSDEGFTFTNIIKEITVDELLSDFDILNKHLENLKSNLKLLFTKEGKIYKKIKNKIKINDKEESLLNVQGEKIKEIFIFLNNLKYFQLDEKVIDFSRTILDMVREINEIIELEKKEINGLDFDDLLLKTRNLLKNNYILGKVRRSIDYLMVDEFQDTNFIQYDIIKGIIAELAEDNILPNSTQLFIVGDAKQSIYGFRNSDVRVFNQALSDMKSLNQKKIDRCLISDSFVINNEKFMAESPEEAMGDIKLTATFRLQPTIASFVDIVCGNLMKESGNLYDIKYDPFICARNIESVYNTADNVNKWSGSVDILFSVKENNNDEEVSEELTGESENIARFILNAVYGENPIQVMDESGNMRKIQFKDIAILSRKRAGFSSLATSFLNKNIPFVVHSGNGFYQTQEISDIISFLYFIHDSKDDISLISLLRSPFFNIDDRTLLILSKSEGVSYWEKLKNYLDKTGSNCSSEVNRAYIILENFIKIADRIPIYKLISKFLQDTGWFGTLRNKSGEKQIIANVEKFLNYAREYYSRGFRNFYDFIDEVKFITEQNVDESESVFITDEDVVNIMTIHASKGLEFPVVILQGTNSSSGKNENFVISTEFGLWFPVQSITEKNLIEQINTPSFLISKEERKSIELAEEKRILYVALTRAKDYLVISAELKKNQDGKITKPSGFLNMILQSLDLNINDISEKDRVELTNHLKILVNNSPYEICHKFNLNIITKIEEVNKTILKVNENVSDRILNIKDISSTIENLNYSPTRIQNFLDDENYYRKKYLLGLPTDTESSRIFFQDNEFDEESGILYGILMHQILEKIYKWLKINVESDNLELQKTIRTVIPYYQTDSEDLFKNLYSEVVKVSKTALIQNNIQNILDAKTEYSLTMPIGKDFLNVKIDLLLKNQKGYFEIWDWKTNLIKDSEHKGKVISHYEFQMKVYAFMLSKIFDQDEYISRLLFTKLANENANEEVWTHIFRWNKNELNNFYDELIKQIQMVPRI